MYFGNSSDALELQTTITHTEDVDQYSYQVTGLANNLDYYWRVDETLDTGGEVAGDIWQFTTIPIITVSDPTLVGWWKFDEGQGKAIDWSGLNQHGIVYGNAASVYGYDGNAMDFDYADDYVELPIGSTISTLSSMTITTWVKFPNIGETLQRILNFGNNDMTVYMYLTANNATDTLSFQITNDGGSTGATLDTSTTLSGGWDHVAVVIDGVGMTVTVYVDGDIVANSPTQITPADLGNTTTNWLGRSQDGAVPPDPYFMGSLDDFRIYNYALTADEIELVMKIDPLRAKDPNPAHGAISEIESTLPISWSPGDNASQHDVYFGTDKFTVEDADTSTTDIYRGRQAGTSFSPSEGVEWGQRYYWRVDEVNNDGTISTGSVWTFEVADYLLIDDFEDYNDYPPDEIWMTWEDGFFDAANGSSAGYPDPDFVLGEHYLEDTTVHEGSWSLPLFYDNSVGISEVTRTFSSAMSDWTRQNVAILTLFYHGDSANAAEPMYVALNGNAVVTNDNTNAALITEWIRWDIPLQAFADLGVDLTSVNSMTIGFGNKANPIAGGEGHVFFDDIRLYRLEP